MKSQLPPAPAYSPPADVDYTPLFEDEYLMVFDKPAGLLSVPGRGNDKQDCLIHRLQQRHPEALIVHRLDMDTSGLVIIARDVESHRLLSEMFQAREVKKKYTAVVEGGLENTQGKIDLPLIADWPNRPKQKIDFDQGKPSLTYYKLLSIDHAAQQSRVELIPYTGRTHQLRLHMAGIGHPILGDRLYNHGKCLENRLHLHASELLFLHPITQDVINITSKPDF